MVDPSSFGIAAGHRHVGRGHMVRSPLATRGLARLGIATQGEPRKEKIRGRPTC